MASSLKSCPFCASRELRRCSGPKIRALLVAVAFLWVLGFLAVSFINGSFDWAWDDYGRGLRVLFVGGGVIASGFAAIIANEA